MKRRRWFPSLLMVGLSLIGSAVCVSPGFADVAILATSSIELKKDSTITGDVMVNNPSDRTLVPGVELQIDTNTMITGAVKADSIGNEPGASADEVLCNDIQGAGSLSCASLSALPLVSLPSFKTTQGDVSAAADILVDKNDSATLNEGVHRDITLERDATLCFEGGTYDVRSITGGSGSKLVFLAPTEIRLNGQLVVGTNAFIGPGVDSGICTPQSGLIPASQIVFYIAGLNIDSGAATIPAAAVFGGKTGQNTATAEANFYVPNGALVVNANTTFTGAVIATDVLINKESTVLVDSAFDFAAPMLVGDSIDVFTDGAAPLLITLTGSDPESNALAFTIVSGSGPTQGSLGPVTPIVPAELGLCSNQAEQSCVVGSGDCPAGGICESQDPPILPPVTSATVVYTPNSALNLEDGFEFEVNNDDPPVIGVVRINPQGTPDPGSVPPDPVDAVVAIDVSAETTTATPVTVTLKGEAPCDGECDGTGIDLDVPLTFSLTGPSPSLGTLSGLTQGTETPQRTATVVYTPTAIGADSFGFEVCGSIGGVVQCDTAIASVSTDEPASLSLTVSTNLNQPITINLQAGP